MAEEEIKEEDITMEFMRKKRFEEIKNQFKDISPSAREVITKAKPEDVLSLTLAFCSPDLEIIEAEVFDEDKFVDLAF